jgi:acetyltransferase
VRVLHKLAQSRAFGQILVRLLLAESGNRCGGAAPFAQPRLRDTVTRLTPLSQGEALEMLDELRVAPQLRDLRREPPVNRSALAETICRFAQLGVDVAELPEIELNPLMASPSR